MPMIGTIGHPVVIKEEQILYQKFGTYKAGRKMQM